jgi:hypothetical protein
LQFGTAQLQFDRHDVTYGQQHRQIMGLLLLLLLSHIASRIPNQLQQDQRCPNMGLQLAALQHVHAMHEVKPQWMPSIARSACHQVYDAMLLPVKRCCRLLQPHASCLNLSHAVPLVATVMTAT